MKKIIAGALLVAGFALFSAGFHRSKTVHGQITQPATTGMVAPMASGAGTPGSIITCNAAAANIAFWNTATNVMSGCNGTAWVDLVSPPAASPAAWYLNNVLVKGAASSGAMKCDSLTGTTNGSGTLAFNYTAMGFTTLWGLPQPTVQGTGTNSYTVNLQGAPTTTGATVIAYQSSLITVVGISVSLIGVASAAPVGLTVCGY